MKKTEMVVLSNCNAKVAVWKGDLVAAWSVLENLAVSLAQISRAFPEEGATPPTGKRQEALLAYFTPELASAIGDARFRLGRCIPADEVQKLVQRIAYWKPAVNNQ